MLKIFLLLFLAVCFPMNAQKFLIDQKHMPNEPPLDRTHVAWPSPERLVTDLRSTSNSVRLKALKLAGVSEAMIVNETSLWMPDQVVLEYAALGSGSSQQAVVTVSHEGYVWVGIGISGPNGWERIGSSGCWCKYEIPNPVGEFVRIVAAPDSGGLRFELVIRNSSGGTGVYNQEEGHFRVYKGEMRRVLSFTSRYRLCVPTDPDRKCTIERRWLDLKLFEQGRHVPGGMLIEGRGQYKWNTPSGLDSFVRDIESKRLQKVTCWALQWDQQSFAYRRLKEAGDPCVPKI